MEYYSLAEADCPKSSGYMESAQNLLKQILT